IPTKRRGTFKKKKAMVETSTKTPRYSLRSTFTKDNKKPLSVAKMGIYEQVMRHDV
ncbi:unnamed protein product, partial [Brassica oleracea var. botrytis]